MSEEFKRNIALMEAHMAEAERCYLEAIPDTTAQRAFSYAYRSAWSHQQTKVNNLTCELNKANELHTQCASELWDCKEQLAALRGYLLEEHKVGGFFSFALKYGLIDADGNPTPLLTGVKE